MSADERAAVSGATRPPPRERAILPYGARAGGVDSPREGRPDGVELEVQRLEHQTEPAELWVMEGGERVWWPKGHVLARDLEADGSGTITVARWIAREKGYA